MTAEHTHRQSTQRTASADEGADYYRMLDVPYSATRADITRAYREAMKRIHPDRQHPAEREAAEEHAKLLNRAFATLSRADSRRTYDTSIKARAVQDQVMSQYFGGYGMPGSADPFGDRFRRAPTPEERRDQRRNDRNAMASVVVVFALVTVGAVAMLVLWGAVSAALEALF